ncbi:hypothetical protein ACFT5C_27450 [Streptomyces sp. NPDC057116]|uniref:hypothetical protein n=1 Tax=Streptomyces sp. NPDC057116 TaxID=3346023 RepID=UPI00363A05EB
MVALQGQHPHTGSQTTERRARAIPWPELLQGPRLRPPTPEHPNLTVVAEMGACLYDFPNKFRRHRTSEDNHRKAMRHPQYDSESVPSVEAEVVGRERLREAIKDIDPKKVWERAIVALTLDGYSQDEIRLMHRWQVRTVTEDEEFAELLQRSSLGSPQARRILERVPRQQARTIQRIADLRNIIAHGPSRDQALTAACELVALLRSQGLAWRDEIWRSCCCGFCAMHLQGTRQTGRLSRNSMGSTH